MAGVTAGGGQRRPEAPLVGDVVVGDYPAIWRQVGVGSLTQGFTFELGGLFEMRPVPFL